MQKNVEDGNDVAKKSVVLKLSITIVLLIMGVGGAIGVMSANKQKEMMSVVNVENIYPNIYIDEIDVGGLTKEKAKDKLNTSIQKVSDAKKIFLVESDKRFEFYFSDFEVKYDLEKSLEEAYLYSKEGTLKERYNKIIALEANPYKIVSERTFNSEAVEDVVSTVAEFVYVEPINATMTRSNGVFNITEGKTGLQMDSKTTAVEVRKLLESFTEGETLIALSVVEPKFKPADLEKSQSLIGTFTTSFSGSPTAGRVINMQVASAHINDKSVYPQEVFSTNIAFGPSTYENGYKDAPEIVGGELVEGIGGGVCQVSSTLYNALLFSELDIVERINHSQKVGYMDWGFDATLAGDYIDLKFKNDTEYPVFIESYLTSNKVVVNIYGNEIHQDGRRLVFSNELIETTKPPESKIKNDSSLPSGQRVTKVQAKSGYKYYVYKTIYQGDTLLEKVKINTSNYKAKAAQILVGTATVKPKTPVVPVAPTETVAPITPAETVAPVASTEPVSPEQPVIQ